MSIRNYIERDDNYVGLVLIHIIMGLVLYIFPPLAKLYFILAFGYFMYRILFLPSSKKTQEIFLACAYFAGAEVLFRMTKGGLAYEASKYLVILFMLMGMFYKGISGKGYPYFIYLILLYK